MAYSSEATVEEKSPARSVKKDRPDRRVVADGALDVPSRGLVDGRLTFLSTFASRAFVRVANKMKRDARE